jgi:hypothetical protein
VRVCIRGEAGRLGNESMTERPPGARRNVVYQSAVERGRDKKENCESLLGKAQRCTREASGAVSWEEEQV